jgi:hypothetical protein
MMSALMRNADSGRIPRHVSNVPNPEVAEQRKIRPKAALQFQFQ